MTSAEREFNKSVRNLSTYLESGDMISADIELKSMRRVYDEMKKLESHSVTFWLFVTAALVVYIGMGWGKYEIPTIFVTGVEAISFALMTYVSNIVDNFIDNIEYWENEYNRHKEVNRTVDDSIK
ncbi:hypothetical protein [Ligilactobacillus salivarius]|uniref:Uncharacterized protein n=1 Tax=Ligilactobacillus salivarius TaxID=1624 RepID=A0A9X6XLM7_9LACO|nr:hypothetical protein [Ligilactobacillus salivarius]OTF89770.1 hypothetical protein A8C38_00380 [Ligilactobacillus salivarius]PAY43069.1 hypothetical protein A8C52_11500 [Ligilactobacillus salivarius]PAY43604.1 hypothetical protein A8C39_00560 [Ligilactobacillus salivarius]PAY49418.1 hypothetical protein A8C42_00705 [Ligilactobacillus salivarius]PAY58036.1 hypothetical protein A8C46_00260 [Ligilactobacillus salivarius]